MNRPEIQKRLDEIAATNIKDTPDDVVLALLAERKKLLAEEAHLQQEQEKEKKEEEKKRKEEVRLQAETQVKLAEEKEQSLRVQLAEINKAITPDQDDDKLLALIQERKMVEAELRVLTLGTTDTRGEKTELPQPGVKEEVKQEAKPEEDSSTEEVEAPSPDDSLESSQVPASNGVATSGWGREAEINPVVEEVFVPEEPVSDPKPAIEPEGDTLVIDQNAEYTQKTHVSSGGKVSTVEDSDTRVALDISLQNTEYQSYLSELKANVNSLGTFLQALPIAAKRNRAFMLEVAKIDPAYAMHYADKDTLKKDEAFNVAIAGMNNQRNTGNALSEMLPEMRTGPVLLAGVKNDFRNVRFIRPEMPEYEEILALAQKGALEGVASLKEAHDIKSLLPPILQKDKAFMDKVQALTKQA